MKGSALTPLMRIALGVEVVGFLAFFIARASDMRWVYFAVAVLPTIAVGLFSDSSVTQLIRAVEAKAPGRLDSYSITGWTPFLSVQERKAWRAVHDPILLAMNDLQTDLQRAREMMPLGLTSWLTAGAFMLATTLAR